MATNRPAKARSRPAPGDDGVNRYNAGKSHPTHESGRVRRGHPVPAGHPWRHEGVATDNKAASDRKDAKASRVTGRRPRAVPGATIIPFHGSMKACRELEKLIDGFPEGVVIEYIVTDFGGGGD